MTFFFFFFFLSNDLSFPWKILFTKESVIKGSQAAQTLAGRSCLSETQLTMYVFRVGNAAGSRDNSAFQALPFISCLSTVIVHRQDETHRCVKKLKWNPT